MIFEPAYHFAESGTAADMVKTTKTSLTAGP
jgi:hypothetical protein